MQDSSPKPRLWVLIVQVKSEVFGFWSVNGFQCILELLFLLYTDWNTSENNKK